MTHRWRCKACWPVYGCLWGINWINCHLIMNYAAMYCNVVQCIAMWQLKYVEIEVVDAVPWHGGVLLGHPAAVSVLLLSDQLLGWNWLGQGWRAIAACINFKYKHDRKAARVGANLTHPRLSKATCDVQLGCGRAHVMSEPILSADATTWKKTKQWWRCSRLQSHKPQVDSCSNALMQETVWKSCNFSSSFHFFKVGVHWVVVSVWTRQSHHCHASHRSSWSCLPRWLPERATKGSVPGQQRRSNSTPRPKINHDKSLDILRYIRYYQRFPHRSRSPSLAATFWDNWARRCRLKFSESLFAFAR